MIDLKYSENLTDLEIRIDAHKKYSMSSLERILEDLLKATPSRNLLDMGCGSGNFSKLFSDHCNCYIGIDINDNLLFQANDILSENNSRNHIFINDDMDSEIKFIEHTFDKIFFIYSIYYSNNLPELIKRTYKWLSQRGQLFIIGPKNNNAIELDLLSENLFPIKSSQEKELRANRIENEILPLVNEVFDTHEYQDLDFSLVFPNTDEYIKYYCATPQYRELEQKYGQPEMELVKEVLVKLGSLTVTKKVCLLTGHKL